MFIRDDIKNISGDELPEFAPEKDCFYVRRMGKLFKTNKVDKIEAACRIIKQLNLPEKTAPEKHIFNMITEMDHKTINNR